MGILETLGVLAIIVYLSANVFDLFRAIGHGLAKLKTKPYEIWVWIVVFSSVIYFLALLIIVGACAIGLIIRESALQVSGSSRGLKPYKIFGDYTW